MSRAEQVAQLKEHLAAGQALADLLAAADPALLAPAPAEPVAPAAPAAPAAGAALPLDEGKFYDWLRSNSMLGPTISQSEFDGCSAILKACHAAGFGLAYTAYALATAYHETAHTMQPIHEMGGAAYFTRLYDVTGQNPSRARLNGNTVPGDGPRYCGRGYVQLTWKNNYARASTELGADLVGNPDLAMQPEIAAQVMTRGMSEHWFTGKGLSDYLPAQGNASRGAYANARRIINGTDRADDIAGYAVNFETALMAAGWHA